MARLIARSATCGLLPVEIGGVRLVDAQPETITWLAPFDGQEAAVSAALGGFPAPGEAVDVAAGRALSVGPGQALILGEKVSPEGAAVADHSDGWTVVALEGTGAREVLARLTPLDLREVAFPVRRTARTMLGHKTASLTRVAQDRYELMVFRSMTRSLVHELTRAMRHLEARAALRAGLWPGFARRAPARMSRVR